MTSTYKALSCCKRWTYDKTIAADGDGGVLKRMADRKIAEDQSFLNAQDMINAIENETQVTLLHIPSDDLSKYDDAIPKDLKTIPGTMQIH